MMTEPTAIFSMLRARALLYGEPGKEVHLPSAALVTHLFMA
jgi:hypothetical protein